MLFLVPLQKQWQTVNCPDTMVECFVSIAAIRPKSVTRICLDGSTIPIGSYKLAVEMLISSLSFSDHL